MQRSTRSNLDQMTTTDEEVLLQQRLQQRFGSVDHPVPITNATLLQMAARSSCRHFKPETIDPDLIQTLCAIALASPTKSDLQQRDIVIVKDTTIRASINGLFAQDSWIANAPVLLIFCANNRRQRQLASWRDKPFPNDHLDAFFNASVDAGIALSAFVTACESTGLGCCPISQIRDHSETVCNLLQLPHHVFPVAGLGMGWPSQTAKPSMRLPLSTTVHQDRFNEHDIQAKIHAYDTHRAEHQPYTQQRDTTRYGRLDDYGWSEDKARQYSVEQRADFGSFIRSKGFILD